MGDVIRLSAQDFIVPKLRAKPVTYTVEISHFVQDGQWALAVNPIGVAQDKANRQRVAADLEAAAVILRQD